MQRIKPLIASLAVTGLIAGGGAAIVQPADLISWGGDRIGLAPKLPSVRLAPRDDLAGLARVAPLLRAARERSGPMRLPHFPVERQPRAPTSVSTRPAAGRFAALNSRSPARSTSPAAM